MIEYDVVNYLENDDTLDTLLSVGASDTKIYPVQFPHGASLPFIIYNITSEGTLLENVKEITISFDCISDRYSTAKSIKDRLNKLLDLEDKIRNAITSTSYWFYWAKRNGGTQFKEPETNYFHNVALFDFKYAEI